MLEIRTSWCSALPPRLHIWLGPHRVVIDVLRDLDMGWGSNRRIWDVCLQVRHKILSAGLPSNDVHKLLKWIYAFSHQTDKTGGAYILQLLPPANSSLLSLNMSYISSRWIWWSVRLHLNFKIGQRVMGIKFCDKNIPSVLPSLSILQPLKVVMYAHRTFYDS